MEKNRTDPGMHRWFDPETWIGLALASTPITLCEVFFHLFYATLGFTPLSDGSNIKINFFSRQ
ncbi:MAG: hypothetical protein GY699_02085 [Desulfobacteraceae bacterium]|nr:hypothetical protein [Desulfobacteraceae bacterium]